MKKIICACSNLQGMRVISEPRKDQGHSAHDLRVLYSKKGKLMGTALFQTASFLQKLTVYTVRSQCLQLRPSRSDYTNFCI